MQGGPFVCLVCFVVNPAGWRSRRGGPTEHTEHTEEAEVRTGRGFNHEIHEKHESRRGAEPRKWGFISFV